MQTKQNSRSNIAYIPLHLYMKLLLKGIIPPVVTPLKNNDEIDEQGLRNLIEHLISGGVHGIFLLGTTGEAPNLSYKLRSTFITKACKLIDKRIPVLVGITDTSFEGSLKIAESAKNAGADALVIAPPYYVPITQNEMIEYLEDLVPKLPLPFIMYNMPSCTKLHMTIDTIRKAKDLGAIGIKDSSGDISYLYSLIEEFKGSPEFSIISGSELYIPETIIYGGHGAVAGGANIFPRLYVDLYEASLEKDLARIALLRQKLIQIGDKIFDVGKTPSKHIKSIKCALSVIGVCNDYVAHPFRKFNKAERKQIEKNLKGF
ncbi:MAG: dihydrodipicolinate synthase family protein [Prolixibacteraceae bacterium]|nr:dihydrodipicolinate synthase family protein [Prolixibacteraceae bacterium]MBT6005270.1 dihydrodipicolinate synthase family protein [Prolixibacteraceae bacterium]MBT6766026.1 dihydrodipicolinate synthase family protein [Prolixibacteraceae bacterium]MBT6997673.1 dihydrodipicolinate synthase family protein [Prolixibacteraceae bacterium]MBT7396109.1 dihydrodipicolinate synthase family protein [Prolixibacteraceae bacterium]